MENPIGITKRFFEADLEGRKNIILTTDGPIIMTNITRDIDKHFAERISKEKYVDAKQLDWYFWWSSLSFTYQLDTYIRFEMCCKNVQFNGIYDGKPITKSYNLQHSIKILRKEEETLHIMNLYDEKGWINKDIMLETSIIIFTERYMYPIKDDTLYTKTLDLCEKYGVDIKDIIENICKKDVYQVPHDNSMITLIRRCNERCISYDKYMETIFTKYVDTPCNLISENFVKFCISNDINIAFNTKACASIISITRDKELIKNIIELHKKKDAYKPDRNFVIYLAISCSELLFEDIDLIKLIDDTVLDNILFYGTSETIHGCIENNFIFKDRIYKIYAPCDECYNGEHHDCNWRNVTANFVCRERFGEYLDDIQKIDRNKKYNTFIAYYALFDGKSNIKEIYTDIGTDELETDDIDYDNTQNKYATPPKKYMVEEGTEINIINMDDSYVPRNWIRLFS